MTPRAARAEEGVRARNRRVRVAAILDVAAELFATRGFHETGIDDVGEAAGITGPAVYRYYPGKIPLLAAVIERGIEHLEEVHAEALARSGEPAETLVALVRAGTAESLRTRALQGLWARESASLPPAERQRFALRMRRLTETWVHLLAEVRPDLADGEARVAAHALQGMIASVSAYDSGIDAERLANLLGELTADMLRLR